MPAPAPKAPREIILLGGASGAGKSYLARRLALPHVELDMFYREIADDEVSPLPRTPYGEIDWDDAGTWNGEAATRCLASIALDGAGELPLYDISTSSLTGETRRIETGGATRIVAEGLFSDAALAPLRAAGLTVTPVYIKRSALTVAVRRFVRDVREHRKPIGFLVRRGVALLRADHEVRQRYLEAGFAPRSKREILRLAR